MRTYLDSSALVPVYVPERLSEAARTAVETAGQVPFTALHRLEVANAFGLLAGRKILTRDEHRAEQLGDDVEQQRLVPVAQDLERVSSEAAELSQRYTVKLLTRSIDVLHVAASRTLQCTTFASADDRQLRLAKATGLRTWDIKQRVGRGSASR